LKEIKSHQLKKTCLLFGTGDMAEKYLETLKYLNIETRVIGRTLLNNNKFHLKTGHSVLTIDKLHLNEIKNSYAINAVSNQNLFSLTEYLLLNGCKKILVEKPVALSKSELHKLISLADYQKASVYVALNRRHYKSVKMCKEIIDDDGGAISGSFDFTEVLTEDDLNRYPEKVLQTWIYSNSVHVIDTFFFLCGLPLDNKFDFIKTKNLKWHENGAVYVGCGQTEKGVSFTMHANWLSGGRWNLEVCTKNRKLILSPMEELHQIKKGSFQIEKVPICLSYDKNFKPGLFSQTKCFFSENSENLQNIKDYMPVFNFMSKIGSYN